MTVAEAWNGPLGQHWAAHPDRYNAMLDGFDEALFDAASVSAGEQVADIGCGSGLTTRGAALRAAGGRVTGVDISEPLLARARELTPGERFPHVTYRLADAQTCAFEPGGYDLVISRGGVMFFADPVAAFTNLAGALRPGGRLAFICPQPARPEGRSARRWDCWPRCWAVITPPSTRWPRRWPRSRSPSASTRSWARRVSRASG